MGTILACSSKANQIIMPMNPTKMKVITQFKSEKSNLSGLRIFFHQLMLKNHIYGEEGYG